MPAASARIGNDEGGEKTRRADPRTFRTGSKIAALIAHIDGRAWSTIVIVDPSDELIDTVVTARPSTLQLHGSEIPERARAIRDRSNLGVMKAIPVGPDGPLELASSYDGVVDRLLLDAKPPKGSVLPGGNGVAFDWSILPRVHNLSYRNCMLSGGLHFSNVGDAIRTVHPYGIDVSSGLESAPGVKSADLIHRFFDAFDAAVQASQLTP